MVPWVDLQCVMLLFPGHNRLCFWCKAKSGRGEGAQGVEANWSGTLVVMATLSTHRLIMGKSLNIFFETIRPIAYNL